MIERRAGVRGEQRASSSTAAVPDALSSAPRRIRRFASGSSAPSVERAEVIEVRADDDVLAAQRRVAARQIANTFCVGSDELAPVCAGGRATKCWHDSPGAALSPSDA